MRNVALLGTLAVILVAAAVFFLLLPRAEESAPPEPAKPGPSAVAPAPPSAPTVPQPVPMEFTREGLAGKIATEAERVARPGNAQVAVCPRNGGHWVCVLVNGQERYADLDQGLRLDDLFTHLRDGGFQPPPAPVLRTMSIYRSLAKRAMSYDAQRGDRLLILFCPRDEWSKLALCWPPPAPKND